MSVTTGRVHIGSKVALDRKTLICITSVLAEIASKATCSQCDVSTTYFPLVLLYDGKNSAELTACASKTPTYEGAKRLDRSKPIEAI